VTYLLRREQWIARPIDEAFAFFASAHNLEEITPTWVGFKILFMSTESIEEGTTIRYRLRLHGIPVHWRTDIREWSPPHRDVSRIFDYRRQRIDALFDRPGENAA